MCGIAGLCAAEGPPQGHEADLRAMVAALHHRGPDAEGFFAADGAALGARRLALVDLEHGNQPMSDQAGGVQLVCNGEIFNHRQLRASLEAKGHVFRTRCDIEVIIYLYLEHGEDFLDHLDGQFALALYDTRTRTLLLARDHFGVCPLYYTHVGGTLVFASEIPALLRHPRVDARLDLTGLDQVMMLPGLVSPRTMFAGISSLPAGYVATFRDGSLSLRQYWDLDYPAEADPGLSLPEDALADMVLAVLARSVGRCLDADVPVGAYLSGGLDSSLAAVLATTALAGRLPATFSVGYHEATYDEKRYIDLIADQVSNKHHHLVLSTDQIAAELPAVVASAATPLRESYNAASLSLSRRVSEAGLRAVIGGEGADELFAGYVGYRFDALRRRRVLPGDEVPAEELRLRTRLWGEETLRYEHDLLPLRQRVRTLYDSQLRAALPKFDCLDQPLVDLSKLRGRHRLHQRSYLDAKLRLADHLLGDHGDRMAMAHSVEMRYPYLSRAMASLATRLHPTAKLRDLQEKAVLKDAARRLLPRPIVDREKFAWAAPGTPSMLRACALRAEQSDLVEYLLSPPKLRRDGLFDPAAVAELRRRQQQAPLSDANGEPDLLMVVLTAGMFTDTFLGSASTTEGPS
ncbi:asparagine synthase (glutamine-hydrolyzing) [Nonomuraea sp. NPDC050556]|uniref:asparagine synthase (glutamine-hydrolyzing) n=1 Tax=Nonomuraea sp. NPDC050556 TaxID=3364369 RepID=UPI0037A95FF9